MQYEIVLHLQRTSLIAVEPFQEYLFDSIFSNDIDAYCNYIVVRKNSGTPSYESNSLRKVKIS